MSDTVIRVEGLSKKYILGHQQSGHKNFREVLTEKVASLAHPFRGGRSRVQDPSQEDFWALRDVDFEIKQGDRVGIIGRNGAGKSTLLKILSRIVEPTEGQIGIRGRVASLLEVGTGFHPELTGRENIFLNGAILGMSKVEITRKFDEIVAFAEVEKFLDTPVKRYSSGMYVRLAFAVAAHLEPEILIVDEVLAVGDAQFQKKCLGKMEDVGKEGRTVLFVSHDMAAMTQLCGHIIWLEQGQVKQIGRTDTIVSSYLSQGTSNQSIITFLSRQSEYINFTKASILDQSGVPTTELDARFPCRIHMEYEVLKEIKDIEMAVRVKTGSDMSVFTSVYSDASDKRGMQKKPGKYSASFEIPGLLLMPGTYTLSFAAFEFSNQVYRPHSIHDNVMQFSIIETGTKIAKYNDHKSVGVILVEFPWRDSSCTAFTTFVNF